LALLHQFRGAALEAAAGRRLGRGPGHCRRHPRRGPPHPGAYAARPGGARSGDGPTANRPIPGESPAMTSGGDWLVLHELLERGDPEFVDRLRTIADADALGAFAERWYANSSPNARRLLLAYLERPLNAYRHEALVKRLFKRAEAAGDDAVMARFIVAFDRSIRRGHRGKQHHLPQRLGKPEQTAQVGALLKTCGYTHT